MIRSSHIFSIAAFGLATLGFAAPANALSNRAWVSGHGADAAGCGSPASPCRSFQYVHDNIIAAGGEIDVLDPAGYGAIAITKALSIVNDGVGTAGVQQPSAATSAITITVGSTETVHLRGLTIDGLGVAQNGVQFNSGASLDIVNCVIRHSAANGINLTPNASSKFFIVDTIVSDNGNHGIAVTPSAGLSGSIKRVAINHNKDGVSVRGDSAPSSAAIFVSAVDSVAADNVLVGFVAGSSAGAATPTLALTGVTATGATAGYGIEAMDNGVIRLAHSNIGGNQYGAFIIGTGKIYSLGDNSLNANLTAVSGGSLTADAPK